MGYPTTAQVIFNGNFAPVAVDDVVQTEEEQPVTIDVLANAHSPAAPDWRVERLLPGAAGQAALRGWGLS